MCRLSGSPLKDRPWGRIVRDVGWLSSTVLTYFSVSSKSRPMFCRQMALLARTNWLVNPFAKRVVNGSSNGWNNGWNNGCTFCRVIVKSAGRQRSMECWSRSTRKTWSKALVLPVACSSRWWTSCATWRDLSWSWALNAGRKCPGCAPWPLWPTLRWSTPVPAARKSRCRSDPAFPLSKMRQSTCDYYSVLLYIINKSFGFPNKYKAQSQAQALKSMKSIPNQMFQTGHTVWVPNLLILPSETLTDSKKVLMHSKPLSVNWAGLLLSIFSRNNELCVSGCMSPRQEANHWKQHCKTTIDIKLTFNNQFNHSHWFDTWKMS